MTNKTTIVIVAAVIGLIAIGALAYYMMYGNQYQYQPISQNDNKIEENIPENNENAPVIREFTVTGKNFSFTPSEIKVKQGDIVKITLDNVEGFHDWTIDEFNARTSQIQAPAKAEAQFTADKTGVFEFYCSVGEHRELGMKGNLIVEGNNATENSDSVSLDLRNKNLTKLPDYVFKMTSLEQLDVSNNKLSSIQAEIRFLTKLKKLNISNNLLTGIPAEIGQLSNLEVLDLSGNNLTGLPYELGNLKKLKTFNISGNSYSEQDLGIISQSLSANVNIIK